MLDNTHTNALYSIICGASVRIGDYVTGSYEIYLCVCVCEMYSIFNWNPTKRNIMVVNNVEI